jgi:hypothetical protein
MVLAVYSSCEVSGQWRPDRQGPARREKVRLQAGQMFEHDMKPLRVPRRLRVSTKLGDTQRVRAMGAVCGGLA